VVLSQGNVITVDGLPVHPLLVHGVVVLLPLAALGGLMIAARGSWRRRYGSVVLALTAAGVALVPLAATTGRQLRNGLPENPLVERHAQLGNTLLPFALAFGVATLLLVIAGRLADREREAVGNGREAAASGTVGEAAAVTQMWRRTAVVAAVLVALTGAATTVQLVRIGHSGSVAVWKGVGVR
jgi:hypothetical protein